MPPAAPIQLIRAGDPPYGLIQSARTAVNGSESVPRAPGPDGQMQTAGAQDPPASRWVAGFAIDPDPCGGGLLIDPCGATGGEDPEEPGDVGPIVPFPAIATVECSTFGTTPQDRSDRAMRKLRAVRSFQLEREFWTGIRAQAAGASDNQWLEKSPPAEIINSGGAMGCVTAFAELEQAIAEGSSWGVGMIHATPRTVTNWANLYLIQKVGNILVSALGTIVVPGRGYPGSGPNSDGVNPLGGDANWAYATTMVSVFLGQARPLLETPAAMVDRSTNLITATAVQEVAAAWDGCVHAAALVLHTSERTAVGS